MSPAPDDAPYVSLQGWRIHRSANICADWSAYLHPETIRHSSYRLETYSLQQAEQLVREGKKVFCRRCAKTEADSIRQR